MLDLSETCLGLGYVSTRAVIVASLGLCEAETACSVAVWRAINVSTSLAALVHVPDMMSSALNAY